MELGEAARAVQCLRSKKPPWPLKPLRACWKTRAFWNTLAQPSMTTLRWILPPRCAKGFFGCWTKSRMALGPNLHPLDFISRSYGILSAFIRSFLQWEHWDALVEPLANGAQWVNALVATVFCPGRRLRQNSAKLNRRGFNAPLRATSYFATCKRFLVPVEGRAGFRVP